MASANAVDMDAGGDGVGEKGGEEAQAGKKQSRPPLVRTHTSNPAFPTGGGPRFPDGGWVR
jgi:hypothetical protein